MEFVPWPTQTLPDSTRVRSNHATGRVVGPTRARFPGPFHVHRLLDVGGVSGGALSLRILPFAIPFARSVRRSVAQLVSTEAGSMCYVDCACARGGGALGA